MIEPCPGCGNEPHDPDCPIGHGETRRDVTVRLQDGTEHTVTASMTNDGVHIPLPDRAMDTGITRIYWEAETPDA